MHRRKLKKNLRVLVFAGLLKVFALLFTGCCDSKLYKGDYDQTFQFDIPEGNATESLTLIAKQADVEFLFSLKEVEEIKTHKVVGSFTLQEAFHTLLEDTPLTVVHFKNSKTYSIKRKTIEYDP